MSSEILFSRLQTEEDISVNSLNDLHECEDESFERNDSELITGKNDPTNLDLNSENFEDSKEKLVEVEEKFQEGDNLDFQDDEGRDEKNKVDFSQEDQSKNPMDESDHLGLNNSGTSEKEIDSEEAVEFSKKSQIDEENGAFEDLPIDIYSSNLIDAENYTIDSLNSSNSKLNDEVNNDPNSNDYSSDLSKNTDESESENVETSPLIPEWANQTENPAFFQNLDIPTFLRRRGSNRPRQ